MLRITSYIFCSAFVLISACSMFKSDKDDPLDGYYWPHDTEKSYQNYYGRLPEKYKLYLTLTSKGKTILQKNIEADSLFSDSVSVCFDTAVVRLTGSWTTSDPYHQFNAEINNWSANVYFKERGMTDIRDTLKYKMNCYKLLFSLK